MSHRITELWKTPEFRKKMIALRQKPEYREKMRQIQLRKAEFYRNNALERWAKPSFKNKMHLIHHSEEYRLKKSIASKKMWSNPTYKEKMSWFTDSTPHTDASKLKLSIKAKQRWQNKKFKEKMIKINNHPVVKNKKSESMKKLWEDKNYRAKTIKSIKIAQAKPSYHENQSRATSLDKNPMWKGGKSFEPYGTDFNRHFKRQVRLRDNHCCIVCGLEESKNRRRLDVHHIDYNKSNNHINNAVSLCTTCHSRTNTKRRYWTRHFSEYINNLRISNM